MSEWDEGELARPATPGWDTGGPADSAWQERTLRGLAEGQRLFGRFVLERVLGRGGMGVVWLARDEQLGLEIALKFLPEAVAHDRMALEDLRQETLRSLRLTHPHIVRVYDFHQQEGCAAIAMEYIDGDTLSNLRLERPGRVFGVADLLPWIVQTCEALDYAHARTKTVHRDLKPANLMVNSAGEVRITDFGIARSLAESMTRVSGAAATSGTLVYMSPQQLDGDPPNPSDDIYSLGATIYELLTGKPPFFSGDVPGQIRAKAAPAMGQRRVELGAGGEPIPLQWEAVVAACLAKDPAARPKTAAEVVARLRAKGQRLEGASSARHSTTNVQGRRGPTIAEGRSPRGEVERLRQQRGEGGEGRTRKGTGLLVVFLLLLAVGGAAAWWFGYEAPRRENERIAEGERVAAEAKQREEEARKATLARVVPAPATASNERPFENSLGMQFVPAGTSGVLFCIWETRVRDYAAYAAASSGVDASWRSPGFEQGADHPVVKVSWEDAKAFCAWLTSKDRREGKIGARDEYRLPSDHEWSCAVGIGDQEDPRASPKEKNMKVAGEYPWGTQWPPPSGAGNYHAGVNVDRFEETSPVGSFSANGWGLYDLGGNVWEWCEDRFGGLGDERVLRGASWGHISESNLRSSCRCGGPPGVRIASRGFRCVLSASGS